MVDMLLVIAAAVAMAVIVMLLVKFVLFVVKLVIGIRG